MRSLCRRVEGIIISHRMLSVGDTVVLAVSGGADSLCLLYVAAALAQEWNWRIHVAHLHHGIRGSDADQDAQYVAEQSEALGLPYHLQCCDIPRLAEQRGLGLEEAGRYARYQFFADLASQIGAQAVATGHHADDQAETVLMNLLRGTGGLGLSGIRPVRLLDNGVKVIRPLLTITRQEIERYLTDLGIVPRHDRTNDELNQTRNRIRHQLLPHLQQYNPRISEALGRTAEIIRSDEQYLMQLVDDYLATHLVRRYGLVSLAVKELAVQPLALLRRIIRRMVNQFCWDAKQSVDNHVGFEWIEELLKMIRPALPTEPDTKHSWSAPLPNGCVARLSQGQLFFLTPVDQATCLCGQDWRATSPLELPEIGSCLTASEVSEPTSGWDRRCHLDWRLWQEDLQVRSWQAGDRISLGAGSGSKKLSDLFIDSKVPAPYRSRIPILTLGGEIVAVTGLLVAPASRPVAGDSGAIELRLLNTDP